jgi:putative heme transporter
VASVRRIGRVLVVAASISLAVFLLAVVLPHALGIGWRDTTHEIRQIPRWDIACLIGVWAAGLWLHTIVLRRALPGLSRRRAFALNLGGSSVSNVLPFGGAAGIGLNYAMLRSWGYNRVQITAFATVSNLIVALVKVFIGISGIVALAFMPQVASQLSRPTSPGAIATMCGILAALVVGIVCAAKWWHGPLRSTLVDGARQLWAQCAHVLRRGWAGFAVGGLGYPMLQVLLLWSCLVALQVNVSFGAVVAAYAVERLLTLIPLTPGGVGVVETAATGVLIGFGADPGGAAAGVILFRVFSYLVEIPLGAVVAAAWFAQRRRAGATALTA